MTNTEKAIYLTIGIAATGIVGYYAYKYLVPAKNGFAPDSSLKIGAALSDNGSFTEPAPVQGGNNNKPQKPSSTQLPKLPSQWQKVAMRFPDGVPFVAQAMTGKINLQIPALSVNRTFTLTQNEQDTINLGLAKGSSLEQAITAWMFYKKMTSALAVKNYK